MNEMLPVNGGNDDDKRFIKEVKFIEKKGHEPDIVDSLELEPGAVVEALASNLDLETNCAANVLALLKIVERESVPYDEDKVEGILDKFRFDGVHAQALAELKRDLLELQYYLRGQVGEKVYRDQSLPATEVLELQLKQNSKFILTAGEDGEPLDGIRRI